MKHFTQTTANGLHTPPCGSSQSKSTRFSLLTSFLLFFLLFVGSNAAWADVTYTGNEVFYFHKKGGSLQWGSVWANDAAVFLQFYASDSNKPRSTKVSYFWDSEGTSGDVMATKVPAGTWNKVRVIRVPNDNRGADPWNKSDYVTLESGKNYLNASNTMDVYNNPRTFHFYISGSTALASTGSEFNAWNGNGTAHSGSITKTLNAGTYKFKLNPTGTVDWRSEFNWWDVNTSASSNDINLRKGTDNGEIWFDLAEETEVTITCDGSEITVTTSGGDPDPEPDPEPSSEVTPVIHGDGLPGLNPKSSGNWDSNTIEMLEYGEDHTFYAEFLNVPATTDNTYRFKIDVNEEGDWWSGAMCNSNVSQANSNVEMVTDDDRISFKMPFLGDVYVFYKSNNDNDKKVWIVAVPKEIGAGSGSNARMHTDLIMDGTNWIDNGINLVRNNNAAVTYQYVTSYIAPACTSAEMNGTGGNIAPKVRFDIKTSSVKVDKPSDLNLALTTQIRRVIYLWNGGDGASSVKRYVIPSYPNHSSDDGWKVWCDDGDDEISGNLVNGSVTVQIGGNKDVKYFITNSSSCTDPSDAAFKSNTVHTVNSFGGCYVDKSASTNNVTFKSDHQVYTRASGNVLKLGNLAKPIVDDNDCRGIFRLANGNGDKTYDVTFTFDGGVITINAVEHVAPTTTYTVTLHPNNGGASTIVKENVPEGSTSSASELGLSSITYGTGIATWYTNAECTTPFTTVTGNMDLYAKWGVSGNYYFVSCLQTASDAGGSGNWSNTLSRQMTYESGSSGKCSFSFIAPSGHMPFEIIKNQDWGQKINGGNYSGMFDNANSDVTISATGGHFDFILDAPKKVTVSYDGKVTVKVEDYSFDNTQTYHIKTSWGNGGAAGNYNTTMTNNGTTNATAILRNVPAGNNSFIISTKTGDNDAYAKVGTRTFHALYVDMSSPSSGLSWNTTSARRDGSDNFNSTSPQADGHYYRNCSFNLSAVSDIRITFDGGKIRCDILPKYTVTFNSNGGSEVASQSVFEGSSASEPSAPTKAGYEFVKWQLSGSDYDFSSAVTGNITLDAVWAYKAVSSVALNESEHTTWVGNEDFVLTLTKNPSDLITKSVVWSSDNTSAASVSNGTVHAAGVGTATITCTVTDMFDIQRSATCEVTVAACEMTTDDLYSMTVTGYNTYSGSSTTMNGLWNESSDNDGPATLTVCNVRIGNNGGSNEYYAYDNNGTVSIEQRSDNDVDKWYRIEAATNLYYLKNVSTGKYMYVGPTNTSGSKGNGWSGNGDWLLRSVYTSTTNAETDSYKFYSAKDDWNNDIIISRADASNGAKATATDFVLSRQQLTGTPGVWSDVVANTVSASRGATQGGNTYKGFQSAFENVENVANPNYKASQMNSSYYRMKADATVRANLENALVYGSVITVRLYADAATSVKLQTAAGDDVETINLNADAVREYSYTVAYGSELVGETAFVIKAADNHAGIASIEVSRTHAVSPADPALTWDDDLSEGVTQSALAGTFQHVASSASSAGAIHYVSSNPAVATVAANGTVTPIMAGSTTITATIEQRECYAEQSITYDVTLTEPTLAELIAADAGAGITLTHDYAENIVIDKAITINGAGHSIGNLTVETAGDLTLSGALTVNDFSIYAQAGNTTIPAASGQVRNAANLTANGNAYFYYTVDPSGHVQHGWYDFTVPFRVNVMTGIAGIENEVLNEDFVNERNYAIMEHLGNKQAAGEYAYKKFRGIMEPCRLYSITLDDDFNYNTIRFQKADGALAAGNDVTLNAYDGIDLKHSNWNGVGNGTLHHADAILETVGYIQVYQSGEKTFLPVDKNEYSLVVGSAFMVQQTGTMTLNQASHDKLLAPRRDANAQATAIQIASEGKPFSDQLYITADELAGQGYTQGVDVAKAGNIGNVNVPQIWTNAYNTSLCAHEAQLIDGEAQYTLSLYAPANGTYTLMSRNIPEGYTLYLTQNGNKLWDMSDTYVLDLTKGTTSEYGLLLVENYKMPTAVDNIFSNTDETTKIMRNGILYILQNGKVFNAQGARVK